LDLEHNNLKNWGGKELDKLFFDIGKLTAEFHSVKNKRFGNIVNPNCMSWKKYLWSKNLKRLEDARNSEFDYLLDSVREYLKDNLYLATTQIN